MSAARKASTLVLLLSAACVTRDDLGVQIREAASPSHLPKVLACYEDAFESAGFKGEFDATVDFDVAKNGAFEDVHVTDVRAREGSPPPTFATCVTHALEESRLTPGGEAPGRRLRVRGLPMTFRDASAAVRANATAEAEHVLVGPRGDRCLGLYTYAPPRPVPSLFAELEDAEKKANAATDDPDARARSWQRAYDVALEMRKRLELDGWQPDVAKATRLRLAEQLAAIEKTVTRIGAKIGCTPKAE